MGKISYNEISSEFNKRFAVSPMLGAINFLSNKIRENNSQKVLDAGCGTGYFLGELSRVHQDGTFYGLDISLGMLRQFQRRSNVNLIYADAEKLPIKKGILDFIYFVNSIHLMSNMQSVLNEAYNALNEKGMLCIIVADVHNEKYKWYVHDFFNRTLELDRQRIPGVNTLKNELESAGFKIIEISQVDETISEFKGKDVLDDPFIEKTATSTLMSIPNEDYEEGLRKINWLIKENPNYSFKNNILFKSILCSKQ